MTGTVSPLVSDVLAIAVAEDPFPAEQVVADAPTSGWLVLTDLDGVEVGVWQMTPGTITDTEADEVFCVVSGRGVVEFLDPVADPVELRPGILVRLQSGWRTRWTITETLRKIAVVPGEVAQP
ncbi:MAG TPA: cupin [Propionibacteriaceae bacterium]|nr:cupin [Propionibacteriaceae bacterium]